ncbi:glycosyltransferase, partial [Vibrio astriarenae]
IYGIDAPGYASLITVMLFLGGVQLIGIGVMGEYIGRLYMESKRRPTYIIESDEYQGKTKANSAPQPVQTQGNEE